MAMTTTDPAIQNAQVIRGLLKDIQGNLFQIAGLVAETQEAKGWTFRELAVWSEKEGLGFESNQRISQLLNWHHTVQVGGLPTAVAKIPSEWSLRLADSRELAARSVSFDAAVGDAEGPGWKLLHGDFRDRLEALEDGSVDAIITDPPYSAEALPMCLPR
jgi:hypothetical protein